jgi:hypothetical protein
MYEIFLKFVAIVSGGFGIYLIWFAIQIYNALSK